MVKKLIDITSSQIAQAPSAFRKEVLFRLKKQKKHKKSKKALEKKYKSKKAWRPPKLPAFSLNWLWAFLAFVLVVIIIGLILGLNGKANLTLHPTYQDLSFQEDFQALVGQPAVDLENKIIPGQFFETTEEKWETFPSTGAGEEGGKASGFITVYNAVSPPRALSFVSQTRFVSSQDGKTFRAKDKVSVPPATIKAGKLAPSTAKIEVIAQEAGESYNIGPSKFSVPGLAGTAVYYNVWAESTEGMKGGFESQVKIVSKDDIEGAKQSLREALEKQAQASLKRFPPEGVELSQDAVLFDNFEASCFQEQGAKCLEFNCYGKIKAKGLGFKSADLTLLTDYFFSQKLQPGQKVNQETTSQKSFAKGIVTDRGSVTLGLDIQSQVYNTINETVFISQVKGQNKQAIEELIRQGYPQIKTAEVKFWPFWLRKAPKNLDKIKLQWVFGVDI